ARSISTLRIDKGRHTVARRLTDGKQIVVLASREGMAIRFDEDDVRSMGRPAYGVRGMDIDKNDYVVGVAVTPKEETNGKPKTNGKKKDETAEEGLNESGEVVSNLVLSVTENGYGKRTDVEQYRLQSRGGKGVINVS